MTYLKDIDDIVSDDIIKWWHEKKIKAKSF